MIVQSKQLMIKSTILILVLNLSALCSYGIKPYSKYINTPADVGLSYIDTSLTTSDNTQISVWHIRHDTTSKGIFLLVYGDAGNKSYLVQHAFMFYHQGYDVVLFDYRGFGGSSDFAFDSTFLYHEEYFQDFKTVFNYTQATNKAQTLHIYAQSMGSIFATRVILEETSFLILDSPVLNVKNAQKALKRYKKKKLNIPTLPDMLDPINVIMFYGTYDYLVQERDVNSYCVGVRHLIYATKSKHLKSLQYLQTSYFDLIEIGMK
ncbi:MAG: alpha/beta superfamily hydrolase [Bacteroidia bacterium]